MGQCKKCGKEVSNSQKFCSNCGETNENYIEPTNFSEINTEKTETKGKNKKKFIIIGAIVVIAIIAIIVTVIVINGEDSDSESSGKKKVNLKKVYDAIDGDGYYVTLASDNSYIKLDTNPLDLDEFSASEAWDMLEELNDELDLPDSIEEKMSNTRSIDGRQIEEFDDIEVSWTYHPDNGLEVLYEKK